MRGPLGFSIVLAALVLAACSASDSREWMKVDQRYTKQEFQRDHKSCTRDGKLDDSCMRQRGWVPVNPSTSESAPKEEIPRSRGRY